MGDWPNPNVAARGYCTAVIALTTGVNVTIPLDTNSFKSVASMHDTTKTAVALSGTVQKTAASTAVVGTGTSFSTQLNTGDRITVPGTANETKVVTAITDNTHLTVDSNFANSASGQSATVDNTGRLVAPAAGIYLVTGTVTYATNATGYRQCIIRQNGATLIAVGREVSPGSVTQPIVPVYTTVKLAQNDYIELQADQTSGGALNTDNEPPWSQWLALSYLCAG